MLLVTDEAGAVRALDFHDYEPASTRLLRLHYGDRPRTTAKRRKPCAGR
jgi:methylated-DNA-[protein]-cysteine S-methyltransferase